MCKSILCFRENQVVSLQLDLIAAYEEDPEVRLDAVTVKSEAGSITLAPLAKITRQEAEVVSANTLKLEVFKLTMDTEAIKYGIIIPYPEV